MEPRALLVIPVWFISESILYYFISSPSALLSTQWDATFTCRRKSILKWKHEKHLWNLYFKWVIDKRALMFITHLPMFPSVLLYWWMKVCFQVPWCTVVYPLVVILQKPFIYCYLAPSLEQFKVLLTFTFAFEMQFSANWIQKSDTWSLKYCVHSQRVVVCVCVCVCV